MAEGGERRFTRTNRGSRMAVLIGEAQEVADGGALPWRMRRACSRFLQELLWQFCPCALCARVAQRRGQPGDRRTAVRICPPVLSPRPARPHGSADRVSVRTVPDEQESAVRTPPSAR